MGRQNYKIKVYLFLLLIVCSLALLYLHFKHSRENEALPVSVETTMFDCTCSTKEKDRTSQGRNMLLLSEEDSKNAKASPTSPSILMEQTRRHISQTARHQWLFFQNQIRILQRIVSSNSTSSTYSSLQVRLETALKYMLDYASEYSRVIDLELKKLANVDGWDNWRRKEGEKLRKIIHNRLTRLQNPHNCSDTPVLVCNLTNPSGFASGVHDVLWCFIKAYSTQRRLVLETSHWHYASGGWETLFRPLSETCQNDLDLLQTVSQWPGNNNNKARWLMRTIPQDLGLRIIRLYGNPLAWWYGQFLWYLMRPNDHLQSFINATLRSMKFSKGIVGIHVRRTDKVGSEAKAHKLEDYMEHAEGYFQSLELVSLKSVKRRVYIATDDPSVLKECHVKYPHYECLYNSGSADMASDLNTRYSNQSLWYLMTDIFALSRTDFIVCTMSSGLCRVAYELKLAIDENSADVSDKVSSLDIPHHYAWVTPPSRKAIYNHHSKSLKELSFSRGDILVHKDDHTTVFAAVKGKTLNGLTKMMNKMDRQTCKEGLVPIFKTIEMFQLANVTSN